MVFPSAWEKKSVDNDWGQPLFYSTAYTNCEQTLKTCDLENKNGSLSYPPYAPKVKLLFL